MIVQLLVNYLPRITAHRHYNNNENLEYYICDSHDYPKQRCIKGERVL